jgi:hypothetical protein
MPLQILEPAKDYASGTEAAVARYATTVSK